MTIETLKLALEALEAFLRFAAIHHDGPDTSDKYLAEDYAVEGFRKARQVLPALRTAIETAEKQKPTGKQSLQVKQEPVAWVNRGENIIERVAGWDGYGALYATPPAAQRQWVGLTDADKREMAAAQYSWDELCSAVEAKLKEKNT